MEHVGQGKESHLPSKWKAMKIKRKESSVQFSCSVISNSLRPHGLRHGRRPCPSPTPRVHSSSCSSSRWCHPTSSSSVIPFSHLQSFPASGSFQMSHFFISGGQTIRVSASASVLPMNMQDWFPLGWTGWISLQSKGLSRVFSNTTVQKHQFFGAFSPSQLSQGPSDRASEPLIPCPKWEPSRHGAHRRMQSSVSIKGRACGHWATSLERPRDPGMKFMSSDPQGRGLCVRTGSGVRQPAFVYF